MPKKVKKRNAQDLTGRNEKALKKLIKRLTDRVEALEGSVFDQDLRLIDVEIALEVVNPNDPDDPDDVEVVTGDGSDVDALPNDDLTQQAVE